MSNLEEVTFLDMEVGLFFSKAEPLAVPRDGTFVSWRMATECTVRNAIC